MIHGFGGNVGEVQPLCQFLSEKGYRVKSPTLRGHTGRRRDLRGVSYQDWIRDVEECLLDLKGECKKVYLIGFSMGGLIAINLASRYKVDGAVTINTPIYYWDLRRIALNIIEDIRKGNFHYIRRYFKSTGSVTLSALFNFWLLLQRTKPSIGQVKCPFLVIQALDDDTVRNQSAGYIFRNVASREKELKYYDSGGHLILRSTSAGRVMKDIGEFLNGLGGI